MTANLWSKRAAVWLWYVINIANFGIAFRYHLAQYVVSVVFLCSFIPYVFYVRWVQPRLTRQSRSEE